VPLPPANLLADETSPYLRQHKGNPVHWRGWSQAALDEARELGRPILLSIGYAACHWCHVMAHESFEDTEVAAVMNRLFVNIKVDREERPDIDQVYMTALHATGEQGGWPLTMFLTPDAKPFWGGTYFPKEPRYGRPGFVQVLQSVHRAWQDQQDKINQSGEALRSHIEARLAPVAEPASISGERLAQLANGIFGMMDLEGGGLRGAPKFPNAPFMHTLWLSWLETGNTDHRDAVITSLRKMLNGGIYDHVGGGLCRYSTDASWLVPHFEKMLYDNAQLIRLAVWAHAETGEKLFHVRIEETIGWLLREMRLERGAFASSLDADSDGEEGLFYTWTREEIQAVLGDKAPDLFSAYALSGAGHWEGKPILHPAPDSSGPDDHQHSLLGQLRSAREKRVRPGRDDKVLVDWNGLAITAIAEAGRHFGRTDWIDTASTAYRFVVESMDAAKRLPHSILEGRMLFPAMSSDYAAMANAAIALHEATSDHDYVDGATAFLHQLDRWYLDTSGTGHFLTALDAGDVPIRIRGDVDEAIPSATSQIVEAFIRVAAATGDLALFEKSWAVAQAAAGRASDQPYGQAGIVNACAILLGQRKLVLVSSSPESILVSAANRKPDPRRVDTFIRLGAEGAMQLPGVAVDMSQEAAWLCIGQACLPPIADPETLAAALRPPRQSQTE